MQYLQDALARVAMLLPVVLSIGCFDSANANPLEQKYAANLGVYAMSSDTVLRVDSVNFDRIGTEIHLEDDLGLKDQDVFRLEGVWRFLPRHKVRLMYFDSNRSTTDELDFELDFGDQTFPVDVDIRTEFDFDIIELAYEYQFVKKESFEIGASIGIHNVGFDVRLTADVAAGGGSASGTVSESASTDAPLPVVGLSGTFRLGSNFYVQAHAQYFQLEYDSYDGSIQDYQAGLLWQFSEHFGIGIAYNLFMTDVDHEDDQFTGKLDWDYEGAQLYLRAGF